MKSGGAAEQALTAIKVVKAFSQEKEEINKFEGHLIANSHKSTRQAWLYGLGKGTVESAMYLVPCYGLLLGGIFITSDVSATSRSCTKL